MDIEQELKTILNNIEYIREQSDHDFLVAKATRETTNDLCRKFSMMVAGSHQRFKQSTDEGASDEHV